MAKIKITISDVFKKHLKVVGYLVVSAVLAYVLKVITDKPEAVYFTPVINYVLFAIEKEITNSGFVKAVRG